MVWQEFIQNEAANRLVLYQGYTGVEIVYTLHEDLSGFDPPGPKSLRVVPSKWLVSPLLSVNNQARAVALEQYSTRLDVFDLPRAPFRYCMTMPTFVVNRKRRRELIDIHEARKDTWIRASSEAENWGQRERPQWRWRFPNLPEWVDRRDICDTIDKSVAYEALDMVTYEPASLSSYRGCVHLNLATDRFALAIPWSAWRMGYGMRLLYGIPFDRPDGLWGPRRTYGLRALSDALTDFQYHGTPFDLLELLNRRRPAPLRFASDLLPDEVLRQIRHFVFADHLDARHPEGLEAVSPSRVLFSTVWLDRCCPQVLEPGERCTTWTYDVNEEVLRSFFDDLEDKGPEHLHIRRARTSRAEIREPPDPSTGNPGALVDVALALEEQPAPGGGVVCIWTLP